MLDKNGMSRIRINFLLALEAAYRARPATMTRLELQQFVDSCTGNGPLGMRVSFPSWLTNGNPNPYKASRGSFTLPWEQLDTYKQDESNRLAQEAARLAAKAQAVAPNTSNPSPPQANTPASNESSESADTDEPADADQAVV